MTKFLSFLSALVALFVMSVSSAQAGISDITGAVDITGLESGIETVLIAIIGIAVLFLAARLVRRALR